MHTTIIHACTYVYIYIYIILQYEILTSRTNQPGISDELSGFFSEQHPLLRQTSPNFDATIRLANGQVTSGRSLGFSCSLLGGFGRRPKCRSRSSTDWSTQSCGDGKRDAFMATTKKGDRDSKTINQILTSWPNPIVSHPELRAFGSKN